MRTSRWYLLAVAWAIGLAAALGPGDPVRADEPQLPPAATRNVAFADDIEPIFARRCVRCHGPEKQESGYRLDERAIALRGGELGEPAIVPRDAARSFLLRAVAGLDPNVVMPPKGERLSAEEIGLIRAWIEQGAEWPEERGSANRADLSWSFAPLQPVQPPAITDLRVSNPIDAFLLARLRDARLDFSGPAEPRIFLRRLYLDVLGLPPTPAEIDEFAADRRPDALERWVDRVLASPRYGERWARHWLDVVRFAETSGFETNVERPTAYRYRDYVIRAFNEDLPYDRFVVEQLAGDARDADAATGFLVGGASDGVKSPDPALTAMQRQDELADMLNTTGTTFLGLTLGCARCHNHKFDPITQRDYYALQAVFAGVEHGERPLRAGQSESQQRRLEELQSQVTATRNELARLLALREPVNARQNEERFPPTPVQFVRLLVRATNDGTEPCIDELEIYASDGSGQTQNVALASPGVKLTTSGVYPNSELHRLEHLNDGRVGNSRSWISNTAGAGWVQIELSQPAVVERIVWGRDREERFRDRLPVDYAFEGATAPNEWRMLADSSDRAPVGTSAEAAWQERIAKLPESSAGAARELLERYRNLQSERDALQAAMNAAVYAGVFRHPAATYRLYRGDPFQPREETPAAIPEVFATPANLASLPAEAPEQARRLHLAQWIASEGNPLTARVIVNRLWHYHFGTGLVATPSDFGKMGEPPSHPELLDWLANELIRSGWSLKHIQRLILTSWAYRQASEPQAEALRVDAGSRLLWRFPPRRLEAEAIRDQMLAVSGALDLTMYGPGYTAFVPNNNYVRVYEPKENWGPAEWRRMTYMLKVRMENDAVFGAFDCPDAGQPAPRRTESTTPLQALNLLHSSFVLQQAEMFAARLRAEAGGETNAQVAAAFRLAFGREPDDGEAAAGEELVRQHGLVELCRALFNANEFLFVP